MEKEGERIVKSTCRMCHGVCGVLIHMKNGRVVKVTGDPDCPTSNGYICVKGKASVEFLYHPDRLKFPLKRVGARGDNKWQRISWDEALDTIAEEFRRIKHQFGAESIVGSHGTGRTVYQLLSEISQLSGDSQSNWRGSHLLPSETSGHRDDLWHAPHLRLLWFWRCLP